jgi:hypothetical protein
VVKETLPETIGPKYAIDLDWYDQNNRSFAYATRSSLCAKCKHKIEGKGMPPRKIITMIKDCCSDETGFINNRQPILESVFRAFLSNGNKPLDVEELSRPLAELRGGDTSRTAPQVLSRLLQKEDYYGIRATSNS